MTTRRTGSVRCARALAVALVALAIALGGAPFQLVADAAAASSPAAFAANRALGRGVNLGNALEAPREGAWGLTLEARWFDLIAAAGFDSVRVPIRFSAHTTDAPPWMIDETFLERVDWVLGQTRRTGLAVILDMHHDAALMADPDAHRERFLAMWRQVAARYADAPDTVLFELLNEPHGAFDDDPGRWNALLADALAAVRPSNPERVVIVGPVGHNDIGRLDELVLPEDPNLIVGVHYYRPFRFTHQGADWVDPSPPVGIPWAPATVGVGGDVQDWSWDTTTTPGSGALAVRFERRYAGFSLHLATPIGRTEQPRLRLRLRGALDVAVGCAAGEDEIAFVGALAHARDGWSTVSADLSACPPDTDRVALMNVAADTASFELRHARLCTPGRGCRWLVADARRTIRGDLGTAAAWGRARGRPMHLGEFGAYRAGDLASRARWTGEVQAIARAAGLSSAYWEFGAGFGVYDPASASWRLPLLDALLPRGARGQSFRRPVHAGVGTARSGQPIGGPTARAIASPAAHEAAAMIDDDREPDPALGTALPPPSGAGR